MSKNTTVSFSESREIFMVVKTKMCFSVYSLFKNEHAHLKILQVEQLLAYLEDHMG